MVLLGCSHSLVEAANRTAGVAEARAVDFFFSAEAWGGTPFSVEDKQQAMALAMLRSGVERLEAPITHLAVSPETPEARVRSFVAVFEVDASVRPPRIRTGYELELLVPHVQQALEIELINGVTGVVNIVEVVPDGAL